jgi:hypothetical protein
VRAIEFRGGQGPGLVGLGGQRRERENVCAEDKSTQRPSAGIRKRGRGAQVSPSELVTSPVRVSMTCRPAEHQPATAQSPNRQLHRPGSSGFRRDVAALTGQRLKHL